MGKIRENMEQLVKEVHGGAMARHHGLASLRLATRDLLARDRGEGQARRRTRVQTARASSTGLAQERQEQLRAARALKTGLDRACQQRRAGAREGSAATRERLASLHGQRQRDAAEAQQSKRGEVAEIRGAVGELRNRVQSAMGALARDVAEARRLWRTTGSARRN